MGKSLFVCSGGGHLKQLHSFTERLGIAPEDQVWITFENALSTALLADREVHFTPFIAPRDLCGLGALRAVARRVLRAHTYDNAFSTGSSPAVLVLPMAAARGIGAHYIESAARADGPSLSGKLLTHFRRVRTYTQYPAWASDRWIYRGSIYDGYAEDAAEAEAPTRIRRAVVTVGTQEGYRFDRLYDAAVPLLGGCEEVLWQTGPQDVTKWGIEGRDRVPHGELSAAMRAADVVIAHAGTGSALSAFDQAKSPILVPRMSEHGEHVDDHQVQIAREMQRRGLATMSTPEALTAEILLRAARKTVRRVEAPSIHLQIKAPSADEQPRRQVGARIAA